MVQYLLSKIVHIMVQQSAYWFNCRWTKPQNHYPGRTVLYILHVRTWSPPPCRSTTELAGAALSALRASASRCLFLAKRARGTLSVWSPMEK